MNLRALGVLLLKLWGLYSLIVGAVAALQLVLYLAPMGAGAERYPWMAGGLAAVTNLAVAAVLLTSAEQIVGFIMPARADEAGTLGTYSPAEVQTVVFGGVGAYFAISGLANLARLIYGIARHPQWDLTGTFGFALQSQQEQLAGAVVQIIAAVILLFGRRGLAATWARVHPMGSAE